MKLSLITPTYNSQKTICNTLDSIVQQTFLPFEYIIIDGNSTDNTLRIIKEYQNKLPLQVISEPDKGIYDAMNKGINIASGDIIGIINSDDFYKNNEILSLIIDTFQKDPNCDAVYGDVEFISNSISNKVVRLWHSGEYEEKKLTSGWTIPHPSLFLRRDVYKKFGNFRTDLELAGDYEFLLRLLKVYKIKTRYIPTVLVSMRVGGRSGQNFKQRKKGWRELKKAWQINALALPRFFILRRVLGKLGQFIFRG